MFHLNLSPEVASMRDRGALFVVSHSGGKDSQAMLAQVRRVIPARQLLIVHAPLGEVEWDGCEELIHATARGLPVILAEATKTFFDMVEHRGMFPSPSNRQCTSDLKRDPINREVRRYLKSHPEFGGRVVSCVGLRAEESPGRRKAEPFKLNARNSVAGREWCDWLPIHAMTEAEVFETIAQAGERPHWVYAAGMRRKSCAFCIMACDADLTRAAELRPDLYAKYVATERRLNFTLSMSGRPLTEITGIAA